MAKFNFHVVEKVTIWLRTNFVIDASSKEDAIEYLKKHKEFNADELECQVMPTMDKNIELSETETLFDTIEDLSVRDNQGQATLEYYDEKNELICSNEKDEEGENE